MQIYVKKDDALLGPFSVAEIQSMVHNNCLLSTDLGCHAGDEQWKPLYQIVEGIYIPHSPTPHRAPSDAKSEDVISVERQINLFTLLLGGVAFFLIFWGVNTALDFSYPKLEALAVAIFQCLVAAGQMKWKAIALKSRPKGQQHETKVSTPPPVRPGSDWADAPRNQVVFYFGSLLFIALPVWKEWRQLAPIYNGSVKNYPSGFDGVWCFLYEHDFLLCMVATLLGMMVAYGLAALFLRAPFLVGRRYGAAPGVGVVAIYLVLGFSVFGTPSCDHADSSGSSSKADKASEAEPSHKNADDSKVAIKDAIKELRKLKSVTEAGLPYTDYAKRVLDAKVELDSDLPDIHDDTVKSALREAMTAYLDARDFWQRCAVDGDKYGIGQFSSEEHERYKKYDLYWQGNQSSKNAVPAFWNAATRALSQAEAASQK